MVLRSQTHAYDVLKALAKAPWANYYLCRDMATERWMVLMIASSLEHNGVLDRVKYGLGRMKDYADAYEETYAEQQRLAGVTDLKLLHYDWLFPQVYDAFLAPEQGNRRVLILDFPDANLASGIPLMQIEQNNLRVDLKTSAWMMGRILKLLSFLQESDIWVSTAGEEYFFVPDQHRLMVLDYSTLFLQLNPSPGRYIANLRSGTRMILNTLGVKWRAKYWDYDYELEDEAEQRYLNCLDNLYFCSPHSMTEAHQDFYKVVHGLWGRKFHPFTVLPR